MIIVLLSVIVAFGLLFWKRFNLLVMSEYARDVLVDCCLLISISVSQLQKMHTPNTFFFLYLIDY